MEDDGGSTWISPPVMCFSWCRGGPECPTTYWENAVEHHLMSVFQTSRFRWVLKPLPDCYIIPARGTQGMLYHVVVVQLDCRSIISVD